MVCHFHALKDKEALEGSHVTRPSVAVTSWTDKVKKKGGIPTISITVFIPNPAIQYSDFMLSHLR
jgi:hypothetical protein